ncbi:MAG: hypothetical protein QNK37_11690 [Acidobacteriota bacterium]|nr:hypothetical protein [Acidobacteriota bacterium]
MTTRFMLLAGLLMTGVAAFAGGSISASPTQVVVPFGQNTGTTTISWSTSPSNPNAHVFVDDNPNYFSNGAAKSRPASWIQANRTYVFRLYSGPSRSYTLLDTVTVTGVRPSGTISASPNPVTVANGSLGSTTITWSTDPPDSDATLFVDDNPNFFSRAASGSKTAPWIVGGRTYTFRLYDGTTRSTNLLAQVTVTTRPDTITTAPNTISPKGTVTNRRPTFQWSSIGGASSYDLEVTRQSTGLKVIDTSVSGTAYTPTSNLSAGYNYTWRVRAVNGSGNGPWSSTAYFAVQPTADLTFDTGNQAGTVTRLWTGANGSFPYAGFNDENVAGYPANWLKNNFPFFTHIRFGNFLFGHCDIPSWAPSDLEEIYIWNGTGYNTNFGQLTEWTANVLDAGLKPHITLTGTPVHLMDRTVNLATYDQTGTFGGDCGNFSHIAEAPVYGSNWQNMVEDLVTHFAQTYGRSQVASWRWTTWTEPDVTGHFQGTMAQMKNIVGYTENAFAAANAGQSSQVPLRLGNFVLDRGFSWPGYLLDNSNLNEIGLSVYALDRTNNPVTTGDLLTDLDTLAASLAARGTPNLGVHVDELGLLYVNNVATSNTYEGLHGAAWLAKMLQAFMDTSLNIKTVSIWHRSLFNYSAQHPNNWVKFPSYEVLAWYDELVGGKRLTTVGNPGSSSNYWREAVSAYHTSTGAVHTLLFDHHTSPTAGGSFTRSVLFSGLTPNRMYRVTEQVLLDTQGTVTSTIAGGNVTTDELGNLSWSVTLSANDVHYLTVVPK